MRNRRKLFVFAIVCILAALTFSFGQVKKEEKVRDPVCGLMVVKNPELSATYNGQTYYFCSKTDRDKFKSNPAIYVK
jgi:YHS domain-containing protein